MKLLNSTAIALLGLVIWVSPQGIAAQNVHPQVSHLLEKANGAFLETPKYKLQFSVRMAEDSLFKNVIQETSGESVKYNNFHFSEQDGNRSLQSGTRQLVLDSEEKLLYVKDYESLEKPEIQAPGVGEYGEYLSKAQRVSLKNLPGNKVEIDLKIETALTRECRIVINETTGFMEYVRMAMINPQEADSTKRYYVEMRFTDIDLSPKLKEDKYSFLHYINVNKVGVSLKPEFEKYKLTYLKL